MAMFSLICAPCGTEQVLEGDNPQWSGDFAQAAMSVGWKAYLDINRGRVVAFCSDRCKELALTKSGQFRRDLGRNLAKS